MPASRSAAATTLAPRSCPSRPGLPTRTRILRGMASPGSRRAGRPAERSRKYTTRRQSTRSLHRPGPLSVPEREQTLGLVVPTLRLVELLVRGHERPAIIVRRVAHHPARFEQIERDPRRLLDGEAEAHVFALGPQQLEPPRVHARRPAHHARAGEVAGT